MEFKVFLINKNFKVNYFLIKTKKAKESLKKLLQLLVVRKEKNKKGKSLKIANILLKKFSKELIKEMKVRKEIKNLMEGLPPAEHF